jgi:hypothetical protein
MDTMLPKVSQNMAPHQFVWWIHSEAAEVFEVNRINERNRRRYVYHRCIKVTNLYTLFNTMYWRIKQFAANNIRRKQVTLMQVVQSFKGWETLACSSIFGVVKCVGARSSCVCRKLWRPVARLTLCQQLRTPSFCSCPKLSCLTLFYL